MSTIWVLGAGQLGAMLKYAGMPLNLDVRPVDIEADELPKLQPQDLVTAEREAWPVTPVTDRLAQHPNFLNIQTFGRLADRLPQKQLLDQLSIPTSPWVNVVDETTTDTLYQTLGDALILKRRTGGYDGRGQHWMRSVEGDHMPSDWRNVSIAERAIPFSEEVSLVGVRNRSGELQFLPLALNLHVDGILMASISPLQRLDGLQSKAEQMLGRIMDSLEYVGVMAMECFRVGNNLLVNELAPRVHNSGHWSLSGASISQFEYHLRATADLPLAPTQSKGRTVMVNLIGTEYRDAWFGLAGSEVYWYGKSVRPGRKVGHINLVNPQPQALASLQALLPQNYTRVLDWVREQLSR